MKKQDKQDKLFKKAYVYGENAFFSANKNRKKSIRIYKKLALLYDDTSAMSNIALTYKDMYKFNKAKKWFKKALRAGDIDASLDIAKIYLTKGNIKKAIKYLYIVKNGIPYETVTLAAKEESINILSNIKK